MSVRRQEPPRPLPPAEPHLTSAVGFCGKITGILYLHVTTSFANRAAAAMLGHGSTINHETENDVMGEIANMITGNLKSVFCDRGLHCSLTVPSIVRGSQFSVQNVSGSKCFAFHFDCEGHALIAEIVLKS